MSESEELETLVYCLGQIGGEHNPVITSGSAFDSKYEYTSKGYARYIREANNVIKFMNLIINYFLESVKSEFEEDPLAFIDSESEEDIKASIQKMKKQWKEMFKEHQKKLREALRSQSLEESSSTATPSIEESSRNPTPSIEESSSSSRQADEDSPEESSSSSAKIPRLDLEATTSEASARTSELEPESTSEADTEVPDLDSEATSKASSVGVPVESLEFPESVFLERLKEFGRVLKTEYQELRAKMGKALDRISPDHTAHDLKGFTLQKMEKFAKWKYAIRTLKQSLENKLPEEYGAFNEKVGHWKYEVLYHRKMKKPVIVQTSNQSDDTYCGIEEMPVDT
ncbi:unnamed protein product [Larinioides sclopetarius]|uniref:Uncharacterized protein n=1 Tax=Larinioides sclopetarius TaxID=280406 RepID=A0AAV1Z2W1_9ARAC